MRHEIRRICKESGVTTVYVTHEQKEALSIADRIAILDRGCIQQIGTPRDVYLRPASCFVASFMGETNLLPARVAGSNRDRARLMTPLGSLTSSTLPAEPLAPGDEVTLSIRPESVVLDVPHAAPNAFAAVLRDSVYLGEIAQHHIEAGPAELHILHSALPRWTQPVTYARWVPMMIRPPAIYAAQGPFVVGTAS